MEAELNPTDQPEDEMMTVTVDPANEAPARRGRGRPHRDWTVNSVTELPLVASFEKNFSRKSVRDQGIIARRLGMGRDRETLEAIGRDFGLTREAMRQIVKRFAKEIFVDENGVSMLMSACEAAAAAGPIPVTDLDGKDSIFEGLYANPAILAPALCLVDALIPDRVVPHIRDIAGVVTLVPLRKGEWEHAVDDAARILRLAIPESSMTRAEAALAHLPEGTKEAVVKVAEQGIGIARHGDIHACVRLFLEDASGPVTLRQIADRVEQVIGEEVRLHRIVTVANRVGVRVARGVYTTQARVDLSPEEVEGIRTAVVGIMRDGPADRQWHASEFIPPLAERDDVRGGLTTDLIAFALKDSTEVRSLGRSIFGLPGGSFGDGRAHLRDLVISIIEAAGRPMRKAEIRKAVSAVRGIGTGFNIIEGRGIVRVAGSLYATDAIARRHHAGYRQNLDRRAA